MSTAHSTTNRQPWGREPVNGIFVVLMPLRSPPRSLVRPAPLMGASPVGGADPRAGLLPSLASLLSTGSRTAVSSGTPGCTPALSGQRAGQGHHPITPSPQTSLPFSGFRTFSLQIGKLRPEQNRLWSRFKERCAHGSHQICQEICDPLAPALNCSPSRTGIKPVGIQGMAHVMSYCLGQGELQN